MLNSPKTYKECLDPLLIRKTSTSFITGEIKEIEFEKRCGTRRKDKCEPCSEIWKDDAYFALVNPSREHKGSLTFITLTAPGSKHFGKTHTASYKGLKSERCACRKYHISGEECIGLPLDAKTFNYSQVADFNYKATRLTSITLQKINRLLLSETNRGKSSSEKKTLKDIRLPMARVMEWQERGVLHAHIIVRGHIPTYIVDMAIKGSPATKSRRRINPVEHKGQRWGSQVDVKHINSSDPNQVKKLSGYITKVVSYALKDVSSHGNNPNPYKEKFFSDIRRTTNKVVECNKTLSECDASLTAQRMYALKGMARDKRIFCIKHRRAHHQIGFTGNVLTMNKHWGSSLKEARERRISHMRNTNGFLRNADKAVRFKYVQESVTYVVTKKSKLMSLGLLEKSKLPQTVNNREMFVSSRT